MAVKFLWHGVNQIIRLTIRQNGLIKMPAARSVPVTVPVPVRGPVLSIKIGAWLIEFNVPISWRDHPPYIRTQNMCTRYGSPLFINRFGVNLWRIFMAQSRESIASVFSAAMMELGAGSWLEEKYIERPDITSECTWISVSRSSQFSLITAIKNH